MESGNLEQLLRQTMDAFPAKSALYAVDLTTGQPIAAIRQDTRVVSASTIKVMILCCALQKVMDGSLSLEQTVPISDADYCEDTEVFEPGYRQYDATLWELLYWMIVSSDNTATNALLTLLGSSGADHAADLFQPKNIHTYVKTLSSDVQMRRVLSAEFQSLLEAARKAWGQMEEKRAALEPPKES